MLPNPARDDSLDWVLAIRGWIGRWVELPPKYIEGEVMVLAIRVAVSLQEVLATLAEARAVIKRWRLYYNHVRPHSAYGGLTPEAVRLSPWPVGCATWKAA